MSYYPFAPCCSFNQNHPFLYWENGFTNEEIDRIVKYCESRKLETAIVGDDTVEKKVRNSSVAWIEENNESRWFYEKLANIARKLNAQYLGFNLTGFLEDMQYTVYDGNTNGHYTWHTDLSTSLYQASPRKLSLVLQLSDPSEYEGGDFQTHIQFEGHTAPKQKGLVLAFPSWVVHRVTPVTSGIRKTLVVWVCGPTFV